MDMVRAHVWIAGRVQGVFFRAETRSTAHRLGICGWVENCPDGKVEAVFEGEKKAVEQAVAWCYHGPPYAMVQDVKLEWEEFQNEFSSFNIRRW